MCILKTIFQIEIDSRLLEFVLAAVVSKIFSTSEGTDDTYWLKLANNILIRAFKRAFNPNYEKLKKNLKKYVTSFSSLAKYRPSWN